MRLVKRLFTLEAQRLVYKPQPKQIPDVEKYVHKETKTEKKMNDKLDKFYKAADDFKEIDFTENFLYGFEQADFEGHDPLLKKAFSLMNASDKDILKFKKEKARKKYAINYFDTGSSAVQVACMSEDLAFRVDQARRNRKDVSRMKGLTKLFCKRRRMLEYLRKDNPQMYVTMMRDYNIQDSMYEVKAMKAVKLPHKKPGIRMHKFFNPRTHTKEEPMKTGKIHFEDKTKKL